MLPKTVYSLGKFPLSKRIFSQKDRDRDANVHHNVLYDFTYLLTYLLTYLVIHLPNLSLPT